MTRGRKKMPVKKTAAYKLMEKAKKPSNYLQTTRAKKVPGKSVKPGGVEVIKGNSKQKATPFIRGGLHASLGLPQSEKIPASKMRAAKAGKYGPKAKKQANMAMGMLAAGRRTAAKNRKRK